MKSWIHFLFRSVPDYTALSSLCRHLELNQVPLKNIKALLYVTTESKLSSLLANVSWVIMRTKLKTINKHQYYQSNPETTWPTGGTQKWQYTEGATVQEKDKEIPDEVCYLQNFLPEVSFSLHRTNSPESEAPPEEDSTTFGKGKLGESGVVVFASYSKIECLGIAWHHQFRTAAVEWGRSSHHIEPVQPDETDSSWISSQSVKSRSSISGVKWKTDIRQQWCLEERTHKKGA